MSWIFWVIIGFVVIGFFNRNSASSSGSDSGQYIDCWSGRARCDKCGSRKFVNVQYLRGSHYDSIYADCARCGARYDNDGPVHQR